MNTYPINQNGMPVTRSGMVLYRDSLKANLNRTVADLRMAEINLQEMHQKRITLSGTIEVFKTEYIAKYGHHIHDDNEHIEPWRAKLQELRENHEHFNKSNWNEHPEGSRMLAEFKEILNSIGGLKAKCKEIRKRIPELKQEIHVWGRNIRDFNPMPCPT